MGRLFWKFFAFVWLAQLAGMVAVGSSFWFTARNADRNLETAYGPEPPRSGSGDRPVPFDSTSQPRALHPPGPPGPPPGGVRGLPPPFVTLTTLIASLVTAALLARYVAKPIRSLRSAFDGVAGGNLSLRVMPSIGTRQDELADLGRDFDRMAERLQASMEGQRRLLHDVSHEVRSPLARLQAAVGLLRRQYDREEPTIERIEEEIVRIDRLIGDLLNLSRIEAGELAGAEEEILLHELMADIVADAQFEAEAVGRSITWDDGADASLLGRPDVLRMAIENVVRNALKHAPESRDISIRTSIDAARSTYTIRVLDSGPGVPPEELAHMFRPFFRSANAVGIEGYGLGLAIAKRSLEAHGGRITASNRPEGGLAVTIALSLRGTTSSTPAPHC